jgi:hypothetical protein
VMVCILGVLCELLDCFTNFGVLRSCRHSNVCSHNACVWCCPNTL